MENNEIKQSMSCYGFEEQPTIYTLCEERRDWRRHIENHITLTKEEIMGETDTKDGISVREVSEQLTNAETNIINTNNSNKNEIINNSNNNKDSIIDAIKSWWSNRPS